MKLLLIVLFSFGPLMKAMAFSEGAVVKVSSYPCGNTLRAFSGSGLLINHEKETYVLTSEHVVLHSNESVCHDVHNPQLGKRKAQLVAADWGVGLSLLKLLEPVALGIVPSLDSLTVFVGGTHTAVTAFGFPFKAQQLTQDNTGRILVEKSQRGFIPLVRELVEVVGGFVEYGMSGGPVMAAGSNAFIGVLSHQALRLKPQGPSEVIDIEMASPLSNHFFVIPGSTALAWVRLILKEKNNFRPQLIRDVEYQLTQRKERVITNGLGFELTLRSSGQSPVGGPEGVGGRVTGGSEVGGPEGVGRIFESPVGGEQIAGITGDKAFKVKVNLAQTQANITWGFPPKMTWFEHLRSALLKQRDLSIPYFVQYDAEKRAAKKVLFASLSEFFSLLQNPALTPVTVIDSEGVTSSPSTEAIQALLKEKSARFIGQFRKLEPQLRQSNSLDALNLGDQLHLLCELLKGEDYNTIDLTWVKELRSANFEKGWQQLFSTEFEVTVELVSLLLQLIEALEKSRVGF